MSFLWDKGYQVSPDVMAFTVGDDYVTDRALVPFDLLGSAAHARGLQRARILNTDETRALVAECARLRAEFAAGNWTVEPADEDGHTAIERLLRERLGAVGGKIHTARSRNDQVVLAVRLWMRAAIECTARDALGAARALVTLARRHPSLVMPGYTHLQRAMPTTAALFALGYAAELLEGIASLEEALRCASSFPLGSGAGYGVPIDYDRAFVAELLGFDRVQEPVTAVQLSRGKAEASALFAWTLIAQDVAKLAFDLELFATREFGFVRLPKELTTGSSMMPQKQNPDVLELMRAHAVLVKSELGQILDLVAKLPGGYHRDFQLTKAPLLRGHAVMTRLLPITALVVERLQFDEAAIARAMTPELWATHEAHRRLASGQSFRDAYQQVGKEHLAGGVSEPVAHELPPPPIAAIEARVAATEVRWTERRARFAEVEARVWQTTG